MGVMGYVVCIYASECVNAALSIGKTIAVTKLRFRLSWFVRPIVTAGLLCVALKFITGRIYIGSTAAEIAIFILLYSLLMMPVRKFTKQV